MLRRSVPIKTVPRLTRNGLNRNRNGLCMLSGRTQRRALPRHQSEEIKIFNFLE